MYTAYSAYSMSIWIDGKNLVDLFLLLYLFNSTTKTPLQVPMSNYFDW
jgi:hypothetical protein